MPGRLLHVKDTVREKGLINKEKGIDGLVLNLNCKM